MHHAKSPFSFQKKEQAEVGQSPTFWPYDTVSPA